jgi:hypothetical protein
MLWSGFGVDGALRGDEDDVVVMLLRLEADLRASNEATAMLMAVTTRLRVTMESMGWWGGMGCGVWFCACGMLAENATQSRVVVWCGVQRLRVRRAEVVGIIWFRAFASKSCGALRVSGMKW